MAEIIDMRTRKKWAGPKPRQVAAQLNGRQVPRAGQGDMKPIGLIADDVLRRLKAR